MAMSVGSEGDDDEVIGAINTTPLVDVMLVLLIIFLITIPVVTHTVPVQLPSELNQPHQTKPENINLAVTKDGDMFWNEQFVPDTNALLEKLKTVAVLNPQPEVHIRGDQGARYEFVGKVMLTVQRADVPVTAIYVAAAWPIGQQCADFLQCLEVDLPALGCAGRTTATAGSPPAARWRLGLDVHFNPPLLIWSGLKLQTMPNVE